MAKEAERAGVALRAEVARFAPAKVSDLEVAQFHRGEIRSLDDLWRAIGEDHDGGINKVADATRIKPERLLVILADCCVREPEPGGSRWSSRHALDLVVILAGLLTAALYLRAHGYLAELPAPWGFRERIPIAAKHLSQGQALRARDFVEAWLNLGSDEFGDLSDLEGLRLARSLPTGSQVRFSDVLREQVVALRDLPRNSLVTRDAVGARWSTFDPDAPLETGRVIGKRTLNAIRKGEVVSRRDLALP